MPSDSRARRAGTALAAASAVALLSGCATYSDRLTSAHLAADSGNWEAGIRQTSAMVGVDADEPLPSRLGGNESLAVLERGVLLQAAGRYGESARDLSTAEQELELLDFSTDALGAIGAYIYSDSAGKYRTPPSERLALNAVNLANYLGGADLEGAAVEARRFQVMREFLDSRGGRPAEPDALGAYLAGFVFEKRGEGDRALRYYDEALGHRELATLARPVRSLAAGWPYRGRNLTSFLAETGGPRAAAEDEAEILVVVASGRVPHKVPERIPVGAAVGLASVYISGDTDVLRYGAGKVLVYPELKNTPSRLGRPSVRVGGQPADVEMLSDLSTAVREEYEDAKPRILAAAITRMLARAAAAEGVRVAGNEESQALGDVLSILFEATLVALDKPDTRSWTMLPGRISVARIPVAPGEHTVEVDFGRDGTTRRQTVRVAPGSWAAAIITEPR